MSGYGPRKEAGSHGGLQVIRSTCSEILEIGNRILLYIAAKILTLVLVQSVHKI